MANRIFIDMDGVLADFDQLKRELGMTGEQLKCMPNAFDLMQPIPGAIEGVRSLIGMGFECRMGAPHATHGRGRPGEIDSIAAARTAIEKATAVS